MESTLLDAYAASLAVRLGAPALKLLHMWRPGRPHEGEVALVRDFVELAQGHGLLAVTEGIVTGPRSAHGADGAAADDGLLTAARTLSLGADIYKAQVPIDAGTSPAAVEALSRALSAIVPCPWVVLSNGVPAERFAELTAAAGVGGASGFLAGRAIWADAISAPDTDLHLADHSARQLRALVEMVDAVARPWQGVPSAASS